MILRIYGATVETWRSYDNRDRLVVTQREICYREFDSDSGELVGTGTEDFSPARENLEIETRWIWTWDGKKRNKGGYRWFDNQGMIKYRKKDKKELKAYLKKRYKAEEVNLR